MRCSARECQRTRRRSRVSDASGRGDGQARRGVGRPATAAASGHRCNQRFGEVSIGHIRAGQAPGSERHQPRRPTRPRLPVRPGDAALCRRRTWRSLSTVSHELLSSKHKCSSLAGTAQTAASGQPRPRPRPGQRACSQLEAARHRETRRSRLPARCRRLTTPAPPGRQRDQAQGLLASGAKQSSALSDPAEHGRLSPGAPRGTQFDRRACPRRSARRARHAGATSRGRARRLVARPPR
jgi:hypothetical protein